MVDFSSVIVAKTPAELGDIARAGREKAGVSLRKSSSANAFGVRFLSEFERGKPTAELGKVMQALHAAGLDLAVVPRRHSPEINASRLSKRLGLEFPYDWSNPNMSEATLISLVLEKTRFNDILRVAHHFGIDRVVDESKKFSDPLKAEMISKYLRRIEKGIALAAKQDG